MNKINILTLLEVAIIINISISLDVFVARLLFPQCIYYFPIATLLRIMIEYCRLATKRAHMICD